ncbi:MAG: permease prefix domain 1-containing protein, partial [Clostridium sp.]
MKVVDEYIDNLYKNTNESTGDNSFLKEDMRTHLIDTINELKSEGISEEESFKIAIDRFGELDEVKSQIVNVLGKKPTLYIIPIIISISLLILYLSYFIIVVKTGFMLNMLGSITPIILIYSAIRFYILMNKKKYNKSIYIKQEIIYFLFTIFISVLVIRMMGYISFWSDYELRVYFDLIPFHNLFTRLSEASIIGISSYRIILGLVKHFFMFIILGLLLPLVNVKFKVIKWS